MLVWVTLLTADVTDLLVSGLIRKGYQVRSAGDTLCLTGPYASIVGLTVEGGKDDVKDPHLVVNKTVKEILKEYTYFSIVVLGAQGASVWSCGNSPLQAPASDKTVFDQLTEDKD
jgi:hypothetical protein